MKPALYITSILFIVGFILAIITPFKGDEVLAFLCIISLSVVIIYNFTKDIIKYIDQKAGYKEDEYEKFKREWSQ